MPRVPVLPSADPSAPSGGRFAVPTVQAPQVDLGASIRGPSAADRGLDALAAKFQEREENQIRSQAQEGLNRFAEKERGLSVPYLQLAGKAAVEARQKIEQDLDEARKSVEDGIGDERAKALFRQSVASRREAAMRNIDTHAERQQKAWSIGETEAAGKNAQQDAISFVGTDRFDGAVKTARRAVDEWADLQGLPPDSEIRRAKMSEEMTALHAGVLDSLVDRRDVSGARAYLEANGAEMSPQMQARAKRLIEHASVADDSTRLAFAVKDKASQAVIDRRPALNKDDPVTDAELADGYRLARADVDQSYRNGGISAEVRDATLQRLDRDEAQQMQTRARGDRSLLEQAQQWMRDNPMEPVTGMPASLYDGLQARGLVGDAERFAANGRYVTDPKTFQEVLGMSPAELRGMSSDQVFTKFRGRLDDSDLRVALSLHAQANKVEKAEETDIIGREDRIREGAARAGVVGRGRMSDAEAGKFYLYREEVQRRVRFEESRLGKKLGTEQLQAIIDNLAIDKAYATETFAGIDWMNPDNQQPVFSMDADNLEQAYAIVGGEEIRLAKIPPGEKEKIVAAISRSGRYPTRQEIAERWVKAGKPGAQGN